MLNLRTTHHGRQRLAQRCKCKAVYEALWSHFDRDIDVGGGASAISVSDDLLEKLIDDGVVTLALGERLRGLAVIIQTDDRGALLKTVIRGGRDHRYGRYVRERKKCRRRGH